MRALIRLTAPERSITTVVCHMHHARTSEHNAVDTVLTYRSSDFRFNHLRRSLTVIIKSDDRHAACP